MNNYLLFEGWRRLAFFKITTIQTGWGMSTSPTKILADFDKNATSYYQKW